jgi:SAM-dependent methyltransferase
VRLPPGLDRTRIRFIEAALLDVPTDVVGEGYDAVVLDNALTRCVQPRDLLHRIPEYVKPGGLLVITSDNAWDPNVTPRNSWLGGFKMNGEEVRTLQMLQYELKMTCNFKESCDISRLRRKNVRQFELDVLEASLWCRQREKQTNSVL